MSIYLFSFASVNCDSVEKLIDMMLKNIIKGMISFLKPSTTVGYLSNCRKLTKSDVSKKLLKARSFVKLLSFCFYSLVTCSINSNDTLLLPDSSVTCNLLKTSIGFPLPFLSLRIRQPFVSGLCLCFVENSLKKKQSIANQSRSSADKLCINLFDLFSKHKKFQRFRC